MLAGESTTVVVVPVVRVVVVAKRDANVVRIIVPCAAANLALPFVIDPLAKINRPRSLTRAGPKCKRKKGKRLRYFFESWRAKRQP